MEEAWAGVSVTYYQARSVTEDHNAQKETMHTCGWRSLYWAWIDAFTYGSSSCSEKSEPPRPATDQMHKFSLPLERNVGSSRYSGYTPCVQQPLPAPFLGKGTDAMHSKVTWHTAERGRMATSQRGLQGQETGSFMMLGASEKKYAYFKSCKSFFTACLLLNSRVSFVSHLTVDKQAVWEMTKKKLDFTLSWEHY